MKLKQLLVVIAFIIFSVPSVTYANEDELLPLIEGIIEWKKESEGITATSPLLSKPLLEHAGDTNGDWYPIGLGRAGYEDDYAAYLAVVQNNVVERYKGEHQLSEMKATEWHRISLAILATGGDPTNVKGINLIEDGTYNRGKTISLGAQGLNGWIWGLITLDSLRYSVPDSAATTRAHIISEILSFQLEDGGFSFYQDEADVDMTAMAIQALAPYYNNPETFTFEQNEKSVTKTVAESIDAALSKLSAMQNDSGGFSSWDEENVESAAQVIVALTSLGIDPLTDGRFIQNGKTLLHNVLTFKQDDGGFIHSKTYNPDNPSSLPDESNSMAGEQVLYALVSMYRLQHDYRSLYDFRAEQDKELKQSIKKLRAHIDALTNDATTDELKQLVKQYEAIPVAERSYVFNFNELAKLLKAKGLQYSTDKFTTGYNVHTSGNGTITPIFGQTITSDVITDEHIAQVEKIGQQVTTEFSVEVVTLIQLFEQAKNKDQHTDYLQSLYDYKSQIEEIEQEIAAINERVLSELYPFNELTLADRKNVEQIVKRVNALSPYDQTKVLNYEDIKKSTTQMENLTTARYIKIGLTVVAIFTIALVVIRIKRRRNENVVKD